jgi:hypothetical protein
MREEVASSASFGLEKGARCIVIYVRKEHLENKIRGRSGLMVVRHPK